MEARLVLPAVAVAVAIAALWWTLLSRIDREERFLDQTTRQHTAAMAQLVEEQAIATFRRLDDLLIDVASHVEKDIPLLIPTRRSFEEGLAASIRIYDANSWLSMGLGRTTTRNPVLEWEEFARHKSGAHRKGNQKGFVIGLPFVSPGTSDVFIPVSRRLEGADGTFRGVAVIDVPAEIFSRFYGRLDLPRDSSVAIARADGPLLARQALQDQVFGRSFRGSGLWPEAGSGTVRHHRVVSPVDGVERIYAFRASADYPLMTVVGESVETVFGAWRQNRFYSIIWAAATTAVILLFTTAFLVELQRRRHGDRALRIRNRAMEWSGDGILIADATRPGSPVVYTNPAFARLMGIGPGAADGRAVREVLAGLMGDETGLFPLCDGAEDAGDMRAEFLRPGAGLEGDAPEVWLELRASPVRGAGGRLVSVIATVRDITEHKTAQAALAEARREADRANIGKSKFLAAASHDLRQPVQSLMLLMEALSTRATDPAMRKILTTMDRALGALKMLLDGLLDVSRLEAGAVEPKRTAFPVTELLDRIAANSRPVAVRKGLLLHIMPCGAHVDSDPMLLGRILQNLVENALRYTNRGRILVGCRRRGAVLRIEVWDTGIGIPTDRQEDIFQEFVQVGNASRDRDQGLGLGLAVVRRLAGMLNHPVSLRSEPGRGSVFRVEVPLADPPAPAETLPEDFPVTARMRAGARVLVVEDDPIVREGLCAMIQQWGHEVHPAGSFGEAVEVLRRHPDPDVIVADYRLGEGHTGTETIREVRRRSKRPIPGILVTGDTTPERLAEAEAGKFSILHKPVLADDLRRAIALALAPTALAPDTQAPPDVAQRELVD
ncbi:response regulator [Azospirillum sp. YIM DDC1]|uniref:histidine kinase n=1 Tax=Azospirillum aestuarii TaxID=2802052 RepID=A0ABS1HVX9_9PROT|nr:ATP-binding protein [Azospirillum aestuarii]MBK4718972.1 response regulator [Azospirillum aestuarii]TWA95597.1 PAS domain S-box-containing protein [Azospirillum brasilense]